MIEFVVGIEREGYMTYISKDKDGEFWVGTRQGAQVFPNVEAANKVAVEYLQRNLDAGELLNPHRLAFGIKIEPRIVIEPEAELTEEQAQGLLDILKRHYKQPVLPMSRFCEAITTWFRCIERNAREWEKKGEPDRAHGHSFAKHLGDIERNIRKSNLLARLLYGGEKLRRERCPVHDGRWSGLEHPGARCPHGCGHTGWIPEADGE